MSQGEFDFGSHSPHEPWRPMRPERLFFGFRLDRDTALNVDRFRQRFCEANCLKGQSRGIELLHLSLHFLGDHKRLPPKIIFAAERAGECVSMPSFEVTLDIIMSFDTGKPYKRPLVLLAKGAALIDFHKMLGEAMRKIGLSAEEHFKPHVTLLYGRKAIPKQPIEPIRFVVRDFFLIHSMRGLSRYNTIHRWSFTH